MEQLEQAMREIEPSAKDNVTINSNAEEMQEAQLDPPARASSTTEEGPPLREITASHIVKAFTRMDNFNAVQGQARIVEALEDAGYSPDDYVPPEDYAEALSRAVNNAVDPGADLPLYAAHGLTDGAYHEFAQQIERYYKHEDIIVPTDPFAAAMIGLLIGLSAAEHAEQDNSSPAEG